jgi:hypothetical protein
MPSPHIPKGIVFKTGDSARQGWFEVRRDLSGGGRLPSTIAADGKVLPDRETSGIGWSRADGESARAFALGFRLTWLRSRCRFLWRWRFTRLAVGSCACSGGHAAQKPDGVRIHTRTQTSASCRPMGTRMGVGASMPKLGSGLTPLRAQVHRSGSRLSLSRCRCRCRLAVTGVRISSCGSYFSPVGGTRFLRRR